MPFEIIACKNEQTDAEINQLLTDYMNGKGQFPYPKPTAEQHRACMFIKNDLTFGKDVNESEYYNTCQHNDSKHNLMLNFQFYSWSE